MFTDSFSTAVPLTGESTLVPVVTPNCKSDACPESRTTSDQRQTEADVREDSLLTSVTWLLVLSVLQKSLGFVRSILVCRWLIPMHVGVWGMSQAIMDMAVPLLLLSIPGSYGRYVEYYRQRGQLKSFLRWTTTVCLTTLVVGIGIASLFPSLFARLAFGDESLSPLAFWCLCGIVPAAIFAYATELLVGARRGKISSLAHFARGTLFTMFAVGFLLGWRRDATAMIAAYAVSFAIAGALLWRPVRQIFRSTPGNTQAFSITSSVRRIAPAIAGYWIADFLTNMFLSVDRYMLIHWSRVPADAALVAVGNYEAALVFPLLLSTVATMVARLILPHQSKDWELGHRARVVESMNRSVRLTISVLIVMGWLLYLMGPWVFNWAFRGQFPAGAQVLPIAITFYIWLAVSATVMNYLWCVERTPWGAAAMFIAVLVNVLLNARFVPLYGIVGAALATLVANAVQLILLLLVTKRLGMKWQISTCILCMMPLFFLAPWAANSVAAAAAMLVIWREFPHVACLKRSLI